MFIRYFLCGDEWLLDFYCGGFLGGGCFLIIIIGGLWLFFWLLVLVLLWVLLLFVVLCVVRFVKVILLSRFVGILFRVVGLVLVLELKVGVV